MKNKDDCAIAVRRPGGETKIQKDRHVSMMERMKSFSLPFVRGIFSSADSLILGMKVLTLSASFSEDDKDDLEPLRFGLFLNRVFGGKLEKVLMGVVMVFSVIPAARTSTVLPLFTSNIFRRLIISGTPMTFLEGVIRVAIFMVYIKLISRTEDIRWTFIYHGAKRRCTNCIERGLDLTMDNVGASSKQHKRCGTGSLIIVMVISILFFMVIRVGNFWLKALSRIVPIPVTAGASYEFLRLAGRSDTWLVNMLSKPGMWMQNLTTKEPDDSMIEVTIEAVNAILDWKEYLKENFPERESSSDSDTTVTAGRRS